MKVGLQLVKLTEEEKQLLNTSADRQSQSSIRRKSRSTEKNQRENR